MSFFEGSERRNNFSRMMTVITHNEIGISSYTNNLHTPPAPWILCERFFRGFCIESEELTHHIRELGIETDMISWDKENWEGVRIFAWLDAVERIADNLERICRNEDSSFSNLLFKGGAEKRGGGFIHN